MYNSLITNPISFLNAPNVSLLNDTPCVEYNMICQDIHAIFESNVINTIYLILMQIQIH